MILENCLFCHTMLNNNTGLSFTECFSSTCISYKVNYVYVYSMNIINYMTFDCIIKNNKYYIKYDFQTMTYRVVDCDDMSYKRLVNEVPFQIDNLPITPTNCMIKMETLINFS